MPFYEYECPGCKYYAEVLQKISDPPIRKCPSCGKAGFKRLISAPVFRLKGSGWYETDFKSDQDRKRNLAGADRDEPKAAADDKPAAGADAKGAGDGGKAAGDGAKPAVTAKADAAAPAGKSDQAAKPAATPSARKTGRTPKPAPRRAPKRAAKPAARGGRGR
jgi:putative FmdB family regulatory protein